MPLATVPTLHNEKLARSSGAECTEGGVVSTLASNLWGSIDL